MMKLEVNADVQSRAMAFLDAYIAAPSDAELTIHHAIDGEGTPAMVIGLCGVKHGFTAQEARSVAAVAESTMRKFPDGAPIWANLILALRAAANSTEESAMKRGALNS